MSVQPITSKAQFDQIINSDKVVFIDFWATWCGPCRLISPVFETLAKNFSEVAEFYKVDVDEQLDISQEVGIKAMPTFLAFKNGQKVGDLVGANQNALHNLIQANINV
ncbi:thioredoxin-like protein [Phlebopus sp. FC_14]|nr:thioredoxin-like protein [Phlebopus sp. FC_14]